MATRILLICGSVRGGSTNAAVLRTAAQLAGPGVACEEFVGMGSLPHFNPDDDREGAAVAPAVLALRSAIDAADALLICTPEYAGALPGALKNLLEWTVGDAGTHRKPVAWINASGPAAPTGGADAHASLRKVLGYVGADIVESACARIPITRDLVGVDGTIADAGAREAIRATLIALAAHLPAPDAAPRAVVPEAATEAGPHGRVPLDAGWWILNLDELAWQQVAGGGTWCVFEAPSAPSRTLGVGVHVLWPGETPGKYHAEDQQEGFLVLEGECLAVVEGEQRRLRRWDYLHCPPGTAHIVIGAAGGPCALLMLGTRGAGSRTRYLPDERAAAYGAAVEQESGSARAVYADRPPIEDARGPWPLAGPGENR